ncbi:MAG TPA: Maf family protein [Rhizomicrobium sp.]|nr:Maf family protein [Rhizomicrobium sp.]
MKLILASASESRARILQAAAVPFEAVPAAIDETAIKTEFLSRGDEPGSIAAQLAEAKALQISRAHAGTLVLGADQVLLFEGELVSKCENMAAARQLLARLRGKKHSLISALALAEEGRIVWSHVDTATLRMRTFGDGFLESYLSREGERLLAGVGCYRLEGMGAQLFETVEGDYFSILGLPLLPLLAELRRKGVIAS